MLEEIIEAVKGMVGSEYLYFSEAVEVKVNPHTFPYRAWAVSVDPAGNLWVMDDSEDWAMVGETDTLLIPSLYQRVKLMEKNFIAV